jgi:hypothetical protein
MSTKSLLRKDASDELARLLTVERLKAAGVRTTRSLRQSEDTNLKALVDCARSTAAAPAKQSPRIRRSLVKKLAGV